MMQANLKMCRAQTKTPVTFFLFSVLIIYYVRIKTNYKNGDNILKIIFPAFFLRCCPVCFVVVGSRSAVVVVLGSESSRISQGVELSP